MPYPAAAARGRSIKSAAVATPWWQAGGATGCLQALAPEGAASYAASLVDLSGNGNDAVSAVAPTWDAVNGWKFDGATQYIDTQVPWNIPVAGASDYSIIVKFSNLTSDGDYLLFGNRKNTIYHAIYPDYGGVSYGSIYQAAFSLVGTNPTSGVYALSDLSMYYNGLSVAGPQGGALSGLLVGITMAIGADNDNNTSFDKFCAVYVQKWAIYANPIGAAAVAAVSAAM